jgi:hypothetical protein
MSEENKTMYYFTEESLQSLVDETMAYADTKNVFVATYGATTYQEVVNAMNSGRVVQARDENGILYNFAVNMNEGIVFTQTDGQSVLIVLLMP